MGMLTAYEETKERLTKLMPNYTSSCWALATFVGGTTGTIMSLPFDNAKTKLQGMVADNDGKVPYKNIFDAMAKTART